MRVFVTGATGFIGSAIVRELIDAGHQVSGLARSDEAASSLLAAGAAVHRGSLDDPDRLRAGAVASDGVIHTAFNNISATTTIADSARADLRAVETLGEALAGSGRPFVITSGIGLLTEGRLATEDGAPDPASFAAPRMGAEEAVRSLSGRGVRASVVRLPFTVHGPGDHGFVPALISIARAKGISAYPGDGSNRWTAVHRLDAAHLFRLALENAPAGARLHGVAAGSVPVREIADVIGRHLNLPVTAISPEEAGSHFGFLGPIITADLPASSALTQKQLGWLPVQPSLIADLDEGHYFKN